MRHVIDALVVIGLVAAPLVPSCFPISPPSPPAPTQVGGATGVGGSGPIQWPTCDTRLAPRAPGELRLNGWRRDPSWPAQLAADASARAAPSVPVTSRWWATNLQTVPDQDGWGACVGFGTYGIACSRPLPWLLDNSAGFRAYQVATRIDHGCAPLETGICPGAYPNADPGSHSSSGMRAGIELGWWRSWVSVPDVSTLIQRLQSGPCGLGRDWRDSEFSPSSAAETCGRLSQTGNVVGGHFMAVVGVNIETNPRRIYVANSWGPWGACIGQYCAYAYLDEPDLVALISRGEGEMVCPLP